MKFTSNHKTKYFHLECEPKWQVNFHEYAALNIIQF